MRRIVITILGGLVISAAFLILVTVWALVGYQHALALLLDLTMPSFNLAALVLGPTAPDDLDGGAKMMYVLILSAWLQIGALAALLVAGISAIARRK